MAIPRSFIGADLTTFHTAGGDPIAKVGGGPWWFFVNEGGAAVVADTLVVSCESDNIRKIGDVKIGRVDRSTLTSPNMVELNIDSMVSGVYEYYDHVTGAMKPFSGKVADHWHIFAHGHHWIACSLAGSFGTEEVGVGLLLLRFAVEADGSVDATKIEEQLLYAPTGESDFYDPGNYPKYVSKTLKTATNDPFIVREHDGVAVGIWHRRENPSDPPTGLPEDTDGTRLFHISKAFGTPTETELYGAAYADHQGLASATQHVTSSFSRGTFSRGTSTFRLLAPTYASTIWPSDLLLIELDQHWAEVGSTTLLTGLTGSPATERSYSMAAEAWLPGGWRAMVYRVIDPAKADPDDNGELQLQLYGPFGNESGGPITITDETLSLTDGVTAGDPVPSAGCRPHILYWPSERLLIVAWDTLTDGYIWAHRVDLA